MTLTSTPKAHLVHELIEDIWLDSAKLKELLAISGVAACAERIEGALKLGCE
jgi:hypothetical protein